MGINIKSCYLFCLDNIHQVFMPTDEEMDVTVEGAANFLEKNIEKCIKNPAGRHGEFRDYSEAKKLFLEYRNRTIPFLEFATTIAAKRFDWKDRYEIFTASDLFMCEIEVNEVDYVACLELTRRTGITQQVKQSDRGVQNTIELNQSILPAASLKSANFFMIHLDKLDITVMESLTSTEDDDTFLYADKILECKTEISIKEAVNKARLVTKEVAKNHKLNELDIMKDFERVVKETVNEGKDIDVKEIAEEVFYQCPEAKESCVSELGHHGVEKPVDNSNRIKMPVKKYHTIKTDTGIEIKIPKDYYRNDDYIEIIDVEGERKEVKIKNVGVLSIAN